MDTRKDVQGGEDDNATVEQLISPEVGRPTGGLSMRPRRTPNKTAPRPLPPPSMEDEAEEELINPFKGKKLRRSPPPGVIPEEGEEGEDEREHDDHDEAAEEEDEDEEPDLPPKPTQKGLADPAPAIGPPPEIHKSPSKKPRRSKIFAERMNSSPMKPASLLVPDSRRPRSVAAAPGGVLTSRPARDPLRHEPRRRRSSRRKFNPARQIEEADPLADKKALRDSLLAQLAQLEDDLKVVSRENERLFEFQHSRRSTPDLPSPEEQDRIIDVLSRHALPPEKEAPSDALQDWLEAAMNPIAFLPFGQANAISLPPFVLPGTEKDTEEDMESLPPVSHHPVPMTADEELPYLQVFTPLTFTSSITTIEETPEQEQESSSPSTSQMSPPPLLQRHVISVASSPPGLFVATIHMTVNTKTLQIAELAVPRLDPAAIGELGPFVENLLRNGGVSKDHKKSSINSALTRNVSVVTWAMGEWVRLATRRAKFWHNLRVELGSREKVSRCAQETRRMGTRKKKQPGRSNKSQDEDEDADADADGEGGKTRPTKAELVSLMGRTSFDLDLSGILDRDDEEDGEEDLTARVSWRIEFDWTGEARNKIGFLLGAPAKCEFFRSFFSVTILSPFMILPSPSARVLQLSTYLRSTLNTSTHAHETYKKGRNVTTPHKN